MKKIDNNFDEKLKKYSDEIKSMEIIYHNGRVKCIKFNTKAYFDMYCIY